MQLNSSSNTYLALGFHMVLHDAGAMEQSIFCWTGTKKGSIAWLRCKAKLGVSYSNKLGESQGTYLQWYL